MITEVICYTWWSPEGNVKVASLPVFFSVSSFLSVSFYVFFSVSHCIVFYNLWLFGGARHKHDKDHEDDDAGHVVEVDDGVGHGDKLFTPLLPTHPTSQ